MTEWTERHWQCDRCGLKKTQEQGEEKPNMIGWQTVLLPTLAGNHLLCDHCMMALRGFMIEKVVSK